MALDKLDIEMLEDVGTGANQLVKLDGSANFRNIKKKIEKLI